MFLVAAVLGHFHRLFSAVADGEDSGGSRSKSRAAKRLEPYNKSPKTHSTERSGKDHIADQSTVLLFSMFDSIYVYV